MNKDNIKIIKKSDGKKYSVRMNRSRIFTPDEWISFLETIKENRKIIFEGLINTGARINEFLHIEKRDIDFDNKTIILRVVKKRTKFSNGRVRTIPISSQYLNKLEEHCEDLNPEDRLFNMSKQGLHQLMKRQLRKCCIKDWYNFSLHNIRKTSECWLNFLGNNHLLLLCHFGHNQSTAVSHYLTTDIYDSLYKFKARQILGDLYM